MTLGEAIYHLKHILSDNNHDWGCVECKQEHEQLLEWLETLAKVKTVMDEREADSDTYCECSDSYYFEKILKIFGKEVRKNETVPCLDQEIHLRSAVTFRQDPRV